MPEPEWTTETLKEYLLAVIAELDKRNEQRFRAAEVSVTAALASAEKAVTKAETAAEKRFEGVNEFRQTLSDQASTFVTRGEVDTRLTGMNEKIVTASSRLDRWEARVEGLNAGWIYFGQIVTLIAAIAAALLAITG